MERIDIKIKIGLIGVYCIVYRVCFYGVYGFSRIGVVVYEYVTNSVSWFRERED